MAARRICKRGDPREECVVYVEGGSAYVSCMKVRSEAVSRRGEALGGEAFGCM